MEEWRDIIETNGFYQVSNYGRFKRLARQVIDKRGRLENYPEIILNLSSYSNDYLQFSCSINSRRITAIAHRLVAKYFIPNPNNYPVINHKDGNKKNNHISNLEWVTQSENLLHSFRELGRVVRDLSGENNPRCTLTKQDVIQIRDLHNQGISSKDIISKFKTTKNIVSKIINYRTWKNT